MDNDAPIYSATNVAELLDEKEAAVRSWHHRGFSCYFGNKCNYQVRYSLRDIVGTAIARDLVNLKFPPLLAARIGATVTASDPAPHDVLEGTPAEIAMIAPDAGSGVRQDRVARRLPAASRSTIAVPVGAIFADVTRRAAGLRHARA